MTDLVMKIQYDVAYEAANKCKANDQDIHKLHRPVGVLGSRTGKVKPFHYFNRHRNAQTGKTLDNDQEFNSYTAAKFEYA